MQNLGVSEELEREAPSLNEKEDLFIEKADGIEREIEAFESSAHLIPAEKIEEMSEELRGFMSDLKSVVSASFAIGSGGRM